MAHSKDRMQEKIQEIKGTVRVDNSHMVDNYIGMATHALESGNNAEAEGYCNKIIEIDPGQYQAWLCKGQAAGWQSTLGNLRVAEAANCFSTAIRNAPDEELSVVRERVISQITAISVAIVRLRANRFASWPEADAAESIRQDLGAIQGAVNSLLEKGDTAIEGIWEALAVELNAAAVRAWSETIEPDYNGNDHPSDWDLERFIGRIESAMGLVELAISLSDEDDQEDVQRYENLIFFAEKRINGKSYMYGQFGWVRSYKTQWSSDAIAMTNIQIQKWRAGIQKANNSAVRRKAAQEKEAAAQRFESYWAERVAERQALEGEASTLKGQIEQVRAELAAIPGLAEGKELEVQLTQLNAERDALGMFKGREKKAIQQKADEVSARLQALQQTSGAAAAPLEEKLGSLKSKVKAITTELTQPR
jgi:hypothetical protein